MYDKRYLFSFIWSTSIVLEVVVLWTNVRQVGRPTYSTIGTLAHRFKHVDADCRVWLLVCSRRAVCTLLEV